MDIQKAYVRHDGTIIVKCYSCGTSKTVNAAKLNKRPQPLKVRCSCQAVFQVFFEFRDAYRKNCNLAGHYAKLPVMGKWVKMGVDNISMTGVGFTTYKRNDLRKGDRLKVRISLDDREKSNIEKKAVVRWVHDRNVGCRFIESDQYDKVLGFYLMP